jgi:hypothetical protein
MPDTAVAEPVPTLEESRGALPSPTDPIPAPPQPNPIFDTPKIEPKPLEESNFMADLAKAFSNQTGDTTTSPAPPAEPPPPKDKEPEKKQEPTLAEPPPNLTPKAKENWRMMDKRVKAEIAQREERIRALETELDTERKRGAIPLAELDKIKTERDELNKRLERFDIERSPLYKEKVLDRQEQLKAKLAKMGDGTSLNSGAIESLLSGDLVAREKALDAVPLSTYRKGQIIEILDQWDNVQEDKTKLLADGKASFEAYEAEQRNKTEASRAAFVRQHQQVFEDQMTLFARQFEVYNPLPYDPTAANAEFIKKWNDGVETMRADARQIHSGSIDPQRLAQVAILAPAAMRYREMFQWAMAQNKQLQEKVAKLQGLQPSARDTGPEVSSRSGQLSSSNGDFVRGLVDRFTRETLH